jgi:Ran GTPase-activating protein (RanGAP) involved in mRNA processing and transport
VRRTLQRLNLSDNTFGLGGATALAASVAKMPAMRWLILRDTGLTEDGAILVCGATSG